MGLRGFELPRAGGAALFALLFSALSCGGEEAAQPRGESDAELQAYAAKLAREELGRGEGNPLLAEQAKLTARDGAPFDSFGNAVAISGDTALIGAYYKNNGVGQAYVFVRSGNVWTEQAKLIASDAAPNDRFGYAVALDGDTAIVGAINVDNGAIPNAGAAYVFVRSGGV